MHKKECQVSNKVETPDLTNRLRSGKIIPRNGATDVAAFKFYLDEVKYRLSGRYGAGNGGLCRGTEQCPVGTDSDAIRCLASTAGKASYLIVEPLVLRSPGGRGAMQHPRPHQKQTKNKKRGVVSYRFRKLEKSILGLQICSLFPRAGVLCHGRVPCGYTQCDSIIAVTSCRASST